MTGLDVLFFLGVVALLIAAITLATTIILLIAMAVLTIMRRLRR